MAVRQQPSTCRTNYLTMAMAQHCKLLRVNIRHLPRERPLMRSIKMPISFQTVLSLTVLSRWSPILAHENQLPSSHWLSRELVVSTMHKNKAINSNKCWLMRSMTTRYWWVSCRVSHANLGRKRARREPRRRNMGRIGEARLNAMSLRRVRGRMRKGLQWVHS